MGAEIEHEGATSGFDYPAFKRAFEAQNVEAWLSFFREDAEWIEYRHDAPPASPHRMNGKSEIADFLTRVKASDVVLELSDEIVGSTRAAFRVTCTMSSGRRIIEHVIVYLRDGKIARQVDVEAWD